MKYKINGQIVDVGQQAAESVLAMAHGAHVRPLCLCRNPPAEMYIARVAQTFYVKRMPNTGALHDPSCESYEPPLELSGLGEVAGSAISEDIETGITSLKLDFSLTKMGSRKAPEPGAAGDTVRTDGKKLTLRGIMHFLWDQAGFNRWYPGMQGKRNWNLVRYHVLRALDHKETKGAALSGLVYMPEPFAPEKKEDISQRRQAKLAPLVAGGKSGKQLMILLAEVKEITDSRYGYKVVVKHSPDYPFMLNKDIYERLIKRFGAELGMWRANAGGHLMMIATFGVGPTGYASIEEASLMMTTPEWIPVENGWDALLMHELVEQRRSFTKGLRYNLAEHRPVASAVLSDTKPKPVALYVLPDDATEHYRNALRELVESSALASWFWQPGPDAAVDVLPAREHYQTAPFPERAVAKAKVSEPAVGEPIASEPPERHEDLAAMAAADAEIDAQYGAAPGAGHEAFELTPPGALDRD